MQVTVRLEESFAAFHAAVYIALVRNVEVAVVVSVHGYHEERIGAVLDTVIASGISLEVVAQERYPHTSVPVVHEVCVVAHTIFVRILGLIGIQWECVAAVSGPVAISVLPFAGVRRELVRTVWDAVTIEIGDG